MVHHISLRLVLFSLSSIRLFARDIFARFDRKRRKVRLLFVCFLAFIFIHMMRKPCSHAMQECTNINPNAYFWILNDHSPNKSFVSDECQPCQWKSFILMKLVTGNEIYSSPAATSRENWSLAPSSWFKIWHKKYSASQNHQRDQWFVFNFCLKIDALYSCPALKHMLLLSVIYFYFSYQILNSSKELYCSFFNQLLSL